MVVQSRGSMGRTVRPHPSRQRSGGFYVIDSDESVDVEWTPSRERLGQFLESAASVWYLILVVKLPEAQGEPPKYSTLKRGIHPDNLITCS